MPYSKEHVAGCLRAKRAKADISRDELAALSGIPAATIGTYENGECDMSFKNAWALADAFGLDMDELFERDRKAS